MSDTYKPTGEHRPKRPRFADNPSPDVVEEPKLTQSTHAEHDGLKQDGTPDGRVGTGEFAQGKVDPVEAGKQGGKTSGSDDSSSNDTSSGGSGGSAKGGESSHGISCRLRFC